MRPPGHNPASPRQRPPLRLPRRPRNRPPPALCSGHLRRRRRTSTPPRSGRRGPSWSRSSLSRPAGRARSSPCGHGRSPCPHRCRSRPIGTPTATPAPAAEPATRAPAPAPAPTPARAPAAKPASKGSDADYRRLLASAERKYEIGRFPEAIAEYRRAVAIRPNGPALVGLARALYDSNQSAEALRTVETAIQTDGRYAPAWLLLGEIHQGDGRIRQARAAYERFLQLEPKGEQATAVREILAKQLK